VTSGNLEDELDIAAGQRYELGQRWNTHVYCVPKVTQE
jgi:hypothetical protein